ncbi:MAG: pentapeptide repeat-containing protein [Pirellulaceae bacterium]|nr:pentapeptide repeat-containing protein [Pirellulaceae bacterium]
MAKKQTGCGSSGTQRTSSKRSAARQRAGSPEPTALPAGRVAGRRFVFTGKLVGTSGGYGTRQAAEAFVKAEGGQVVAELDASVDYLVVGATRGSGNSGAEKKALQLNQKKGARIQVLDELAFLALFAFTADEIVALLESGAAGLQRLQTFRYPRLPIPRIEMHGSRLRSVPVQGGDQSLDLTLLQLDHADLQGWIADRVHLQPITAANLDGAVVTNSNLEGLIECSARRADLSGTERWSADFSQSDLTEAKLAGAKLQQLKATGATLTGADLTGTALNNAHLAASDLRRANLAGACLQWAELTDVDLSEANLEKANLLSAKLKNCNLTKANLAGADLTCADLSGCQVDGAKFSGAVLTKTGFSQVNVAAAIDLEPAVPTTNLGPALLKLDKVARQSGYFETKANIALPDGQAELRIANYGKGHPYATFSLPQTDRKGGGVDVQTVAEGMWVLGHNFRHGTLDFGSVTIAASHRKFDKKELKQVALAAWCEALGVEPLTPEDLKKQKAGRNRLRRELLALLQQAEGGAARWNALGRPKRAPAGHFRKSDLAQRQLAGVDMAQHDFAGSDFRQADLSKAQLEQADLKAANFAQARLDGADFSGAKCGKADFSHASLRQVKFHAAAKGAQFAGADLTGADLSQADLSGADLSGAVLAGVTFGQTRHDERTRWPAGFQEFEGLHWVGKGPDPKLGVLRTARPAGPIDLATFLQRLEEGTDKARLDKALSMLKADRFKLFVEVKPDSVVGIVKSQSNPDLVYSCRLAADGHFGCCTQNLNICGGLRGALCKHLLVLLIGLTKGGELDPTAVDDWVEASRLQKPAIDKEIMSETFLRYKGAEAGEVDWRPTETIPEDYYAM